MTLNNTDDKVKRWEPEQDGETNQTTIVASPEGNWIRYGEYNEILKAQKYTYIGKDSKPILARKLEDERDALMEENNKNIQKCVDAIKELREEWIIKDLTWEDFDNTIQSLIELKNKE